MVELDGLFAQDSKDDLESGRVERDRREEGEGEGRGDRVRGAEGKGEGEGRKSMREEEGRKRGDAQTMVIPKKQKYDRGHRRKAA